MSRFLHALRFALRRETSAYGFTLAVWGTSAVASVRLGKPGVADVFAYVGGALVAAALIVALAVGVRSTFGSGTPERRAFSAMHLLSVPPAILAGWGMTTLLGPPAGYFMASFVAVAVYEALLSVEIGLALVRPESPEAR